MFDVSFIYWCFGTDVDKVMVNWLFVRGCTLRWDDLMTNNDVVVRLYLLSFPILFFILSLHASIPLFLLRSRTRSHFLSPAPLYLPSP